MPKPPDKFKRWMIASFFLIPLVIFGSIGAYYAYFPVKMRLLICLLAYDKTRLWARQEILRVGVGGKKFPYLIDGFASSNPRVRRESFKLVFERLNHTPPPRHWDKAWLYAVEGLWSRNANKRLLSAQVLQTLAPYTYGVKVKIAAPRLMELLSDPEAEVRAAAARALGEIGSDEAVGPLITSLKKTPTPPPEAHPGEWRFHGDAVRSLEKITTGQAFGDIYGATTDAQRQAIIQKWLDWWEQNKHKYETGGEGEN